MLMFYPEAAVHRVRDRSNDVHTHTQTPALRSFLISCVASAQQRKGGHVDGTQERGC